MNKITLLCAFLLLGSSAVKAQKMDFSAKKYEPLKAAPSFNLDSSESKEPLIYVFDRIYTEYVVETEDGENPFRYYITHTLKYLNDDKAVDDENKFYLPMYSEKSLDKLVIRVYKDGKLVSESTEDDLKTVELEEVEVKQVALKGVSKGCLIETFVRKRLSIETYDFEYFQDEAPRRKVEFRLYVPRHLVFSLKTYNGLTETRNESDEDRRLYYTEHENVPGLKEEKYCFQNANRMRVEYYLTENKGNGSKFALYPEMGRDFFEGIMEKYSDSKKVIKTVLKNAKVEDEDEAMVKVSKIEQYIKSDLTGLRGFPPYPNLADIFKNKLGSQNDILRLYMYSFRKLEIEYEVVITSDKSQRRFDKDFDTWTFLTDILFYFPESKQYLDPNAMYARLGRINDNFLGQDALFVKPIDLGDKQSGLAKIRTIQKNKVDQNEDVHSVTLRILPDMQKCEIDYTRKMSNYADMNLRYSYHASNEMDAKEILEGFVKGDAEESEVEILTVNNSDLGNPEEYGKPWEINAKLTTAYYLENAGDKVLIKVGELIGAQTEMYSESPRQQPIEISYAHRYVRHIVIEIPDGYQAKGLEKLNMDLQYKNAAGEYSMGFTSKYKVEGNKVIIECVEYYADLDYPIEQYDDFAKVINAAADFNKISILIEKQ